MHVAYKHLESKLRIGELTVGQWGGLLTGLGLAILWGLYLSPFGAYPTLLSAIYLGGIPAAAAFLASLSEFDFWLLVRSAIRWKRSEGRYLACPGQPLTGYVVERDPNPPSGASRDGQPAIDLEGLWDA